MTDSGIEVMMAQDPMIKMKRPCKKNNTNLDSKIERGTKEEATKAYILVCRGDDDEGNKVI
jgi:hypothetical protein